MLDKLLLLVLLHVAINQCCLTKNSVIRVREKAFLKCSSSTIPLGGPSAMNKALFSRGIWCIIPLVIPKDGFRKRRSVIMTEETFSGHISVSISDAHFAILFSKNATLVDVEFFKGSNGMLQTFIMDVSEVSLSQDKEPAVRDKRDLLAAEFCFGVETNEQCLDSNACSFEGDVKNASNVIRFKRSAQPQKGWQKKKPTIPNKPKTTIKTTKKPTLKIDTATTKKPMNATLSKSTTHKPTIPKNTTSAPQNSSMHTVKSFVNSTVGSQTLVNGTKVAQNSTTLKTTNSSTGASKKSKGSSAFGDEVEPQVEGIEKGAENLAEKNHNEALPPPIQDGKVEVDGNQKGSNADTNDSKIKDLSSSQDTEAKTSINDYNTAIGSNKKPKMDFPNIPKIPTPTIPNLKGLGTLILSILGGSAAVMLGLLPFLCKFCHRTTPLGQVCCCNSCQGRRLPSENNAIEMASKP